MRQKLKQKLWAAALCSVSISISAQDASDTWHDFVSQTIIETANYIDDFFANERRNTEGSRSQLVVSYAGIFDSGAGDENQYLVNLRLHLPKTENKFRLLLQNAMDYRVEPRDSAGTGPDNDRLTTSDFAAALQYVFAESEKWQVSTRAGLKLQAPPETFIHVRIRRFAAWQWVAGRVVQQFYWSKSQNLIEETTFELEKVLDPRFFTRFRLNFVGQQHVQGLGMLNSLALYQKIRHKSYIRYDLGYQGHLRQDFELQRVFMNVRYRRNIWKKWIFYEAVPELYRDESDWGKARFLIKLRFDLVFGKVLA